MKIKFVFNYEISIIIDPVPICMASALNFIHIRHNCSKLLWGITI